MTNLRRLLPPGSDLRSETGRRFSDLYQQYIGAVAVRLGGVVNVPPSMRDNLRTVCTLIVWTEQQSASLTADGPFDCAQFARAAALIERLLFKLGLADAVDGATSAGSQDDGDFPVARDNPLIHSNGHARGGR